MRIMKKYLSSELKEYRGDRSPLHQQLYQSLLENSAVQYVDQMGSLFSQGPSNPQKDFWEWQAGVTKPVKCVSYRDIPGLEAKVDAFLESDTLVKKECYYNSIKAVWNIPGVEYVEGVANLIIPIDHAWNSYKGYYFDLTAELVLHKDVTRFDYAQVIKFDRKKMDKYVYKTKVAGGYIADYYMSEIRK